MILLLLLFPVVRTRQHAYTTGRPSKHSLHYLQTSLAIPRVWE
jgi:hypothetical protein